MSTQIKTVSDLIQELLQFPLDYPIASIHPNQDERQVEGELGHVHALEVVFALETRSGWKYPVLDIMENETVPVLLISDVGKQWLEER